MARPGEAPAGGRAATAGSSSVALTGAPFHAREARPSGCTEGFTRSPRRKGPSDRPHILSSRSTGPRAESAAVSRRFLLCPSSTRTTSRVPGSAPRRSASARGSAGPPDRQAILIRQISLLVGAVLVLGLLLFVVNGCRNSARENALKDYNRAVGSIVSDSDSQVGKPFFDLLRNPGTGDLEAQVASFMSQAETQFQQAKRIDTPGDMTAAAALLPRDDGDAARRLEVDRRPGPHRARLQRRGGRHRDPQHHRRDAAVPRLGRRLHDPRAAA